VSPGKAEQGAALRGTLRRPRTRTEYQLQPVDRRWCHESAHRLRGAAAWRAPCAIAHHCPPSGSRGRLLGVAETTVALAYESAADALRLQQSSLDALRARAAFLLSAASVATSFLSAQALTRPTVSDSVSATFELSGWQWVATCSFVGVALAAILVLLPWRNWWFVNSAKKLIRDYVEDTPPATVDEMHRDLALHMDAHYDRNETTLNRLYWCFRAGCFLLTLEVVAWMIDLAKG
jgi:hypothetical protein